MECSEGVSTSSSPRYGPCNCCASLLFIVIGSRGEPLSSPSKVVIYMHTAMDSRVLALVVLSMMLFSV
jgi:hypothetical protein